MQRAPADQPLVDDDEHPLADRPQPVQALLADDALQLLVDGAGDEAQGQLAERVRFGSVKKRSRATRARSGG